MIILLIVMTGLMAGIYCAFSVFIMKALAELPAFQAAEAMNNINDVIVNTLFLPMFFGSTLWYVGLIVWSLSDWQSDRSILMVTAALIYIVGMFCITVFGNVPLNKKLKENESDTSALIRCWGEYRHKWTRLNHLRMISCIVSCAMLAIAQT